MVEALFLNSSKSRPALDDMELREIVWKSAWRTMHWFALARLSKVALLRISVIWGLLAGFALSPKLWLSSRLYPLTPVWAFLRPLKHPWDYVVFFALIALLMAVSVEPRRGLLIAAFVLLALMALQDQSRWQPWFYQYVVMLLAIALAGPERQASALNTCCLIVAATYIWSGLAKLNPSFTGNTFPWLVEPFIGAWPGARRVVSPPSGVRGAAARVRRGGRTSHQTFSPCGGFLRNRNACFHPHHGRSPGAPFQRRRMAVESRNDCIPAHPLLQAH